MGSVLIWSVTMTAIAILSGFLLLLFRHRKSGPPQKCDAVTGQEVQPEETAASNSLVAREEEEEASSTVTRKKNKREKLVWSGMETFDLKDCDSSTDADGACRADPGSAPSKPQRPAAHRAVQDGPCHLPNSRFHRDVLFNVGFPAGVQQTSGFHGLFHLSLIYRRDTELRVRWKLTLKTNANGHQMEPLACGVVDGKDLRAESALRCFREPRKHVRVDILQSSSDVLRGRDYFARTSSCRFYLSLHRDYITEPFRAPSAGFMLTARRNSENAAPSVPFIHLPDAARLAEFLLSLDAEYRSFMSFFKWRQFYNARRRLTEQKEEFLCQS